MVLSTLCWHIELISRSSSHDVSVVVDTRYNLDGSSVTSSSGPRGIVRHRCLTRCDLVYSLAR